MICSKLKNAIRGVVTGELSWPLTITGKAGTGKTCAALCLLDRVDGKGLYFTASDFAEATILAMKDRYPWKADGRSGYLGTTEFWRMVSGTRLFVLDELGARGSVTDHQYDSIKRLLDAREFKPLILISNITSEKISKIFDDRVFSRINCGTLVDIQGSDMRSR